MQHPQTLPAGAVAPAFWPTMLGLGIAIFLGFFILGLGFAAPLGYGVAVLAFWFATRTEGDPDWRGFYRGLVMGLSAWFVLSVLFVFGLMASGDHDDDHTSFSGPRQAVATRMPQPR